MSRMDRGPMMLHNGADLVRFPLNIRTLCEDWQPKHCRELDTCHVFHRPDVPLDLHHNGSSLREESVNISPSAPCVDQLLQGNRLRYHREDNRTTTLMRSAHTIHILVASLPHGVAKAQAIQENLRQLCRVVLPSVKSPVAQQ